LTRKQVVCIFTTFFAQFLSRNGRSLERFQLRAPGMKGPELTPFPGSNAISLSHLGIRAYTKYAVDELLQLLYYANTEESWSGCGSDTSKDRNSYRGGVAVGKFIDMIESRWQRSSSRSSLPHIKFDKAVGRFTHRVGLLQSTVRVLLQLIRPTATVFRS